MNRLYIAFFAFVMLGSVDGYASTIYDNTVNDTGDTLFYSVGSYSQIGDSITVVGPGGPVSSAVVQLYNDGSTGTFDAVLRFFLPGGSANSPVGAQIGSNYALLGQRAEGSSSVNLTFNTIGLSVPNSLVFTVQVVSVSGGADLGVNLFDPPVVGSSDDSFLITSLGNVFSETSVPNGDANVFFQLNTTTPEPSTWSLCGLAVITAAMYFLRRR